MVWAFFSFVILKQWHMAKRCSSPTKSSFWSRISIPAIVYCRHDTEKLQNYTKCSLPVLLWVVCRNIVVKYNQKEQDNTHQVREHCKLYIRNHFGKFSKAIQEKLVLINQNMKSNTSHLGVWVVFRLYIRIFSLIEMHIVFKI